MLWMRLLAGGIVLGTTLLLTEAGHAAETEVRHFAILIDGKRAGDYHLTLIKGDDGSILVGAEAGARVSFFIKTYTYHYHGTELWKDGRLMKLESACNDDGKAFQVTAVPNGNQLLVTVNGQPHATRPDVWTTTYWHLADPRFHNQGVPLLDADTGKDLSGVLRQVGTSPIAINGAAVPCAHWRVTGGVTADIWYDAQQRMVRQETIEDGHRTLLELVSIRH